MPPPQVVTMIVKEVKLMTLSRGLRLHQYLDDWLIRSQSQEEAQVNTQAVVDLTQSLGWIINQEKSELKPTQVFSFVGCEYHLDSALTLFWKSTIPYFSDHGAKALHHFFKLWRKALHKIYMVMVHGYIKILFQDNIFHNCCFISILSLV